MTVVESPSEFRHRAAVAPRPVVLVPTMGALHAGHLALVARAREMAGPAGTVAVSIFVNPIQFDRPGDLAAYPRPLEADLAACRAAGVDLVFVPAAGTMYPTDHSVIVCESRLSRHLCGATRPGHFDGVCTVVLKLFQLAGCEFAVFGEKDYQQLAIVRRMVRDLDLAPQIIGHPTVREPDGLAMSSRNVRLGPAERADAPRVRAALLAAAHRFEAGERRAAPLLETAHKHLAASPILHIDYLQLVDAANLEPVDLVAAPAVLATAVFYQDVRLIDNLTLIP